MEFKCLRLYTKIRFIKKMDFFFVFLKNGLFKNSTYKSMVCTDKKRQFPLRGVWCDKKLLFELLIGRNFGNHLYRRMNLWELIEPP